MNLLTVEEIRFLLSGGKLPDDRRTEVVAWSLEPDVNLWDVE